MCMCSNDNCKTVMRIRMAQVNKRNNTQNDRTMTSISKLCKHDCNINDKPPLCQLTQLTPTIDMAMAGVPKT